MHINPEQVRDIFGRYMNATGMMPLVLDMRRSQGVRLIDEVTRKLHLDFFGFFASSMLGMNHPKLESDNEALERIKDAALNKIANSDIQTTHMARLLNTFGRIAQPASLPSPTIFTTTQLSHLFAGYVNGSEVLFLGV